VMESHEGSEGPDGRDAKEHEKTKARQAARGCAFAPRLEHGDRSNHEQQNRSDGNSFQSHTQPPKPLSSLRDGVTAAKRSTLSLPSR
jgi:hypothetical protein